MSGKSKLFANSALYTLSSLGAKGLAFVLVPVYTYYLRPEDYGLVNLIVSFVAMVNYLVLLSLDSGLMRFWVDYADQPLMRKKLYGNILLMVGAAYGIFLLLFWIFYDFLQNTLFEGIPFLPYLLIALLILFCSSVFTIHRRYLETVQEGKILAGISFLGLLMGAGTAVSLLVLFNYGAAAMLLSTLVADGFYLLFMIVDVIRRRLVVFSIDLQLMKRLLAYSLPIIPHNISGYAGHFFSRYLIKKLDSIASLGIFSLALQFTSLIEVFQDSCGHAYRPWLNKLLQREDESRNAEIHQASLLLLNLYSVVYILIGLFAFEVIVLMVAPSFRVAWKLLPLLVAVYSLNSIYYFYIYQAFYYKHVSNKIFLISIVGSAVYLGLVAALTPFVGILGAVLGLLGSIVVRIGGLVTLVRNIPPIGYNLPEMFMCLLQAWAVILIGNLPAYYLGLMSLSWPLLLFKIVLFAYFAWILYRRVNAMCGDAFLLAKVKDVKNKFFRGRRT